MAKPTPPKTELALTNEEGALSAPILYADSIGGYGTTGGVVNLTLCAHKHLVRGGKNSSGRVVVAHLRLPFQAAAALREAINNIDLSLRPVPNAQKN